MSKWDTSTDYVGADQGHWVPEFRNVKYVSKCNDVLSDSLLQGL